MSKGRLRSGLCSAHAEQKRRMAEAEALGQAFRAQACEEVLDAARQAQEAKAQVQNQLDAAAQLEKQRLEQAGAAARP